MLLNVYMWTYAIVLNVINYQSSSSTAVTLEFFYISDYNFLESFTSQSCK